MIWCPKCKELGLTSKIFLYGGTSTLLGHSAFYDESGDLHLHDPNWFTQGAECSNKHKLVISKLNPCPSDICMYGKADPTINFIPEKEHDCTALSKEDAPQSPFIVSAVLKSHPPCEVCGKKIK